MSYSDGLAIADSAARCECISRPVGSCSVRTPRACSRPHRTPRPTTPLHLLSDRKGPNSRSWYPERSNRSAERADRKDHDRHIRSAGPNGASALIRSASRRRGRPVVATSDSARRRRSQASSGGSGIEWNRLNFHPLASRLKITVVGADTCWGVPPTV